jgi:hypothetical protein
VGPDRPTCDEVLQWGTARSMFLADGGVENSMGDPVKLHSVKRRSILFDLPYWKVPILASSSEIAFVALSVIELIYAIHPLK